MNRGKQGGPTKDSRWWEARRDREVKQFRMESWKRIGQFGKRPKNSSRKTESRKLARKLGSLSVFRGRPPGYEKYEIWFSRVVNGYTALYVYMCVCVCVYIYIYISLSFSGPVSHSGLYPSLYRRSTCVSWEDLGGPLSVRAAGHCPLRNGQTGPRGADLYPFQSYPPSFHGKTPFLVFSSK